MTTAYDEVAYPTKAFRQTHPDRLAAHAMLFGLPCAPVEGCRVLEIGGGDGGNVIVMALTNPNSRFVTFDLAKNAVRRGEELIAALGVKNVRIVQADILEADFGVGCFDYVIAHGVYSWIPPPVREAMMALIERSLAPHGVAFVSYNALPGCRVRQMLRDMLLFRLAGVTGVEARAEAALGELRRIAETFPETNPYQILLKAEAVSLIERPIAVMAHDELGDVYNPVNLFEFMADCSAHGLRFLTEAEASRCGEGFLPPYALDDPQFDVLAHAQEMDFTAMRYFRQSLVVKAGVEFSRRPHAERLAAMHVSSPARRNEEGSFDAGRVRFEVTDEALAAAVERIGETWPGTVPVDDVVPDPERLAALLRMYWTETVELHAAPSTFPKAIGERPAASPLARLQARAGATLLTTLRHEHIEVKDPFSLDFIGGLDGSRTRGELARDAAASLGQSLDVVRPQLDASLQGLFKMALLIA